MDESGGSGPGAMPRAEVEIDEDLVGRLLTEQHPDLADRPLSWLTNGWDNAMLRLGDDLVVRLPRRRLAAELVEHEQRWLPALAPSLPLPIPAPVRVGRPSDAYPWAWSVLPWIDGRPAGADPDLDGTAAGEQLGSFLAALHRPAPAEAPANPFRGGPLTTRHERFLGFVERIAGLVDTDAVLERWHTCLDAPRWDGPPLWLHGDLHAHNLLSAGGRLVAVIDFGDITAGDPATDLAAAWSLLDDADHEGFRLAADSAERPIDDAMWLRADGWALAVGTALLASSGDNPAMAAMGRRMTRRFLLDPDEPDGSAGDE
ncbi:MAG: aminoglycoside phosphotransferase family protein [Actinomycetota bacterium]